METKTPVKPEQSAAQESPWSSGDRALRLLWEFCWFVFCVWTPKPANPWRLFWLDVFGATIEGKPFVHQRARIAIPWHLTLRDRACLGDRANAYSLGEIEIGARATVAQEAYLSTGTHDFSHPALQLVTAKITIGDDAFIGARAFIGAQPRHIPLSSPQALSPRAQCQHFTPIDQFKEISQSA